VLMKNHSCSLISLVAGPKEERLQMVRPRLDQWHCAKPGAILEVPGFADVFQSLRHCAEVVFQQPLLFRFFRLIRSTFAQWKTDVSHLSVSWNSLHSVLFSDLQWRVGANGLQIEVFEVCHRGSAVTFFPKKIGDFVIVGVGRIEMWRPTVNLTVDGESEELFRLDMYMDWCWKTPKDTGLDCRVNRHRNQLLGAFKILQSEDLCNLKQW
jgi:hypothetical protein